ncbi:hypothetical protein D3C81_1710050 [compost metagenome]
MGQYGYRSISKRQTCSNCQPFFRESERKCGFAPGGNTSFTGQPQANQCAKQRSEGAQVELPGQYRQAGCELLVKQQRQPAQPSEAEGDKQKWKQLTKR